MTNKISSASDYRTFSDGGVPCTHHKLLPYTLRCAEGCGANFILDIGCGNGAMANALFKPGRTIVGIDPSEVGISYARKNYPLIRFECVSIYDGHGALDAGDFDMVVATEVIEHLFYPRELLKFASAKLKPGGLLLLSTPYHGWLKNVAIAVLNAWDKHHTVLWDGGHIKFWSKRTLTQALAEEGFECAAFHGVGRVSYLWESMILVARKRTSAAS